MQFQAHLEIEVPTYFAGNDPLLTYATPLHPEEEHTTTRQELIGKVKTPDSSEANEAADESNSSTESDVKSWSLDHAYLSKPISSKGKLVKSKKIDYKNIMWPRDALYISYKEQNFEFVMEAEANGDIPYYCDCCDPSRQSKKRGYSDDEEDDEDDEDDDDDDEDEEDKEEEEEDDKVSTTSSSVDSKAEKTEPSASAKLAQPGWFGKGRRKKPRC